MYLRGRGELFLAERDANGNPVKYVTIDDHAGFEMSIGSDKLEVRENISGLDRVSLSIPTGLTGTLTINFRSVKPENAALMMYGVVVDVTTGNVTNEAFRNPVASGETDFLRSDGKITALVITDSAGTPVTLVAGTNYLHDGYGQITWLTVTGFTQPFKAAYTAGAIKRVPLLTVPGPQRALLFQGKNTAARNTDGSFKRIRVRLHKAQFNPVETFPWVQENEVASIPVGGSFVEDPTKPESTTLSRYGDILYLD